jgi:hypothetical protein
LTRVDSRRSLALLLNGAVGLAEVDIRSENVSEGTTSLKGLGEAVAVGGKAEHHALSFTGKNLSESATGSRTSRKGEYTRSVAHR